MRNAILNLLSSILNLRCSWQNLGCRLTWLCCAASLVLAIGLVYRAVTGPSRLLAASKAHAKQQAERAATQLGQKLAVLMPVAQGLARDLSTGTLLPQAVEDRLRATLAAHAEIPGIGVAYTPYAAIPDRRLYAPYVVRQHETLQLIYIEDFYDYTQPDHVDGEGPRTAWYHRPLTDGAGWIEPYFGTASNAWRADYSVPFYHPGSASSPRTPIGVVSVNFSLSDIRRMAGALNLDYPGYRIILSQQGTLLAHPVPAYLGRSLAEVAAQDVVLDRLRDHVTPGHHMAVDNPDTGQSAWVIFTPIPQTPWLVGVVFTEEGVFRQTEHVLRRQRLTAGLAVLAFLWWLIVLLTRAYSCETHRLWSAAVAFAVCCGLGIGWIWFLAIMATFDTDQHQVVVLDQVGVEAALYQHAVSQPQHEQAWHAAPPLRVPTGVFVHSLDFSGANDVTMSGYVWQRYIGGLPDGLTPGVIFPEAESSDEFQEAYRDDEVIGWSFRVTLHQQFDHTHYPFDREDVWLRLWPKDFSHPQILMPDFAAYSRIHPAAMPGTASNFAITGWDLQQSFFSYRFNTYNTNFGLQQAAWQGTMPELYFNMSLRRDILGPFIVDMIPLQSVVLLIFAVLLIATKRDQLVNSFGFNTATVLAYCAALLFVLTVSHANLRDKLAAHGIIYLENFYFVMYFAILAASINAIAFASTLNIRFIHYHDNLLIKLLYWPVIQGLLLGITVGFFY
jgi:hypothetical protein